jgi:hypothetical protein
MAALLAGAALALIVACLPAYTFTDSATATEAGGDAAHGADASITLDAGIDASPESPDAQDGPVEASAEGSAEASLAASTIVASVGGKIFATGYGEGTHLFYAVHDQHYWFFYVDDTTGVIHTRVSPDLATWTDATLINVGVADGNNFNLAYADLQGTDVVHLVANATSTIEPLVATKHVRATIAGGALMVTDQTVLPDTPDNGSQSATCPTDAPSVTILPDGHVYDATAWTAHPTICDTNVYVSAGVDTGASWTASFVHDGYYISSPGFTYSHELRTLADAGIALAVWPDQDTAASTLFNSIGWAFSPTFVLDAGAPGTPGTSPDPTAEIFQGTSSTMSSDDWSVCALGGSDVHVVRHTLSMVSGSVVQAFQEAVWDGARWSLVPAAPSVRALSNTGVALVSGPDPTRGMLLAVLALDNTLNVARWTSAAGWTTVATLPGAVQRQSLAGSGCGSHRPYVFWTEGAGPYAIMGADLSRLL